jgi:hypothetical protein
MSLPGRTARSSDSTEPRPPSGPRVFDRVNSTEGTIYCWFVTIIALAERNIVQIIATDF